MHGEADRAPKRELLIRLGLVLVPIVFGLLVCGTPSSAPDRLRARSATIYTLELLGRVVPLLLARGIDTDSANSVEELVTICQENALLDPHISTFTFDGWGNPLTLQRVKEGRLFRIVSNGKDEESQEGWGDDLYVEIVIASEDIQVYLWDGENRRKLEDKGIGGVFR
jgi:hypothetical protein